MDWSEYKRLCDRPYTFSRWMLEQSIELVRDEPSLAELLERTLNDRALDKPPDHRGGATTDMFILRLEPGQAVALYQRVRSAARDGRCTSATRERGLGGFVAAWCDYAAFVERQAAVESSNDIQ